MLVGEKVGVLRTLKGREGEEGREGGRGREEGREGYHASSEIILFYPIVGILCGKCRSGRGVSALLNRCISCHDASGMLILALSK